MNPREKQEKNKVGFSPDAVGMICTVISGILFGTMPLMAKSAYALGSNAYTIAFGRFLTGALFSGIVLLIRYGTVFKLNAGQMVKVALLSIFFSAMPCMLYSSYEYIDSGLATTLHFTYPIIVMLISVLVFKTRSSKIFSSKNSINFLSIWAAPLCITGICMS